MKIVGPKDIVYYTRLRTKLEVELAKSMYELFGSSPIIDDLRNIVGFAIENLVGWDSGSNSAQVRAAMTEEKSLDVWRGQQPTGSGLHEVWKQRNTWSPADCADLLRLFGTVIEKTNIGEGEGSAEHAAARAGGDARFKNIGDKDLAGRSRVSSKDPHAATHYTSPASHIAEGRSLIKQVKLGGEKKFYGIMLYRLMPKSTVRKIDVAFGLPEGADISGTTADSLFGMGRVLNFTRAAQIAMPTDTPVPVLQLLPLVSMIAQGHHTLVESALVLTLNGVIEYSIGAYTTLVPSNRSIGTATAIGQIRKLCAAAESHTHNIPLLAFYDPVTSAYSAYLFERNNKDEMRKFRELATVGDEFLTKFRNQVTSLVTRDEIHALMDEVQLAH